MTKRAKGKLYDSYLISGGFWRLDDEPIREDVDDLTGIMLGLSEWFEERGYAWMAAGKPGDRVTARKRGTPRRSGK